MEDKKVIYRLEIDYYSKEYDDRACQTSTPIYSLEEGLKAYHEAIKEKCIDDNTKCARAELWKYGDGLNDKGRLWKEKTIVKNF